MNELDSIKAKIKKNSDEIKEMKKEIKKYKEMNQVIENVVLAKLASAKKSLKSSYDQIKKGYSSDTADKKVKKLKEEIDEVNLIVNQLKGKILSESNKQIRTLEIKKQNKEKDLKNLNAKRLQLENNIV